MNCIEKTRRRMKNENEVNILRQIYFVGEKKNGEGKRGKYFEKENISFVEGKNNGERKGGKYVSLEEEKNREGKGGQFLE